MRYGGGKGRWEALRYGGGKGRWETKVVEAAERTRGVRSKGTGVKVGRAVEQAGGMC